FNKAGVKQSSVFQKSCIMNFYLVTVFRFFSVTLFKNKYFYITGLYGFVFGVFEVDSIFTDYFFRSRIMFLYFVSKHFRSVKIDGSFPGTNDFHGNDFITLSN